MKSIHKIKGHLQGALFFLLLGSVSILAQDTPPLQSELVRGNVWMLSGGGYANISVLAGNNRALMVDSKRPELFEEIRSMVNEISNGDVAYLINGHVHPDHTDGNAGFGKAGALIIAHEEVRRVLMAGQRGGPPAPSAAWPGLTIPDNGSLTIHFDGEVVTVIHAPPAHSPGNVMVHFQNANVIHLGDLYSPERYPVLAGGSIDGFIAANELALSLGDDNTVFIAGNGVVTGPSAVRAYIDMVSTVKARISRMIQEGLSQDEIVAENPTAEFDSQWGNPGRFLPGLIRELSNP